MHISCGVIGRWDVGMMGLTGLRRGHHGSAICRGATAERLKKSCHAERQPWSCALATVAQTSKSAVSRVSKTRRLHEIARSIASVLSVPFRPILTPLRLFGQYRQVALPPIKPNLNRFKPKNEIKNQTTMSPNLAVQPLRPRDCGLWTQTTLDSNWWPQRKPVLPFTTPNQGYRKLSRPSREKNYQP